MPFRGSRCCLIWNNVVKIKNTVAVLTHNGTIFYIQLHCDSKYTGTAVVYLFSDILGNLQVNCTTSHSYF